MDPTGCIWNKTLFWLGHTSFWKRTVIICVPFITTMEWCNPLRLDLRTYYSKLQFYFLCSLTFLLVWLLSSLLSGMFILSPKVSTDTLFIACVGIKHKGCFLGIFTLMDWWKSVKSQREYTTFGVMVIIPLGNHCRMK